MQDSEGKEIRDGVTGRGGGYRYFGAAKQLPGVRELFEKEPPRKVLLVRFSCQRKAPPAVHMTVALALVSGSALRTGVTCWAVQCRVTCCSSTCARLLAIANTGASDAARDVQAHRRRLLRLPG